MARTAGEIATALMLAAESAGESLEVVEEAVADWTEGPFRPSDYSPALVRALRAVTPTNHVAVAVALAHFEADAL